MLFVVYLQWIGVTSLCYYVPRTFRILDLAGNETLDQLLTCLAGEREWLNDNEFKAKCRISKNNFNAITEMLETTPPSCNATAWMRPVSTQFGVFLFYVGNAGKGGNNPGAQAIFAKGRGMAKLYRTRCLQAIIY
jgi:hypothetical protein